MLLKDRLIKEKVMKKIFILLVIFSSISLCDELNETYNDFVSQKGTAIKFCEYYLPFFDISYSGVNASVRKYTSGKDVAYFYLLSYRDYVAAITYEDLLELINAVEPLREESENDMSSDIQYTQNVYITNEGLKLGYYYSSGMKGERIIFGASEPHVKWLLIFNTLGSNNTAEIGSIDSLKKSLIFGKNKIDDLVNK